MDLRNLIFTDPIETKGRTKNTDTGLQGEYSEGDVVLVNGLKFTLTEFIKTKKVVDPEGNSHTYSWYKAKEEDKERETNLFFFDTDLDCQEDNNPTAEDWFETYGEGI